MDLLFISTHINLDCIAFVFQFRFMRFKMKGGVMGNTKVNAGSRKYE